MKPSPNGPRGNLVTGHLRPFYKDQLGFLTQCAREYGDVVRLRFLHLKVFLISHPDYIEYVLGTNNCNFVKPKTLRLPLQRMVFGKGLLSGDGKDWLVHRRHIHHSFQQDSVNHYANLVACHTESLMAVWERRKETDIYADMRLLAATITSHVLFGIDSASQTQSLVVLLSGLAQDFRLLGQPFGLIHHYLPTKIHRKFKRDLSQIDQIIYSLIRQRRSQKAPRNDLLATLLSCRHGDGSQLTDRQIREEVTTLFMAGHETPAIALAWTFYLLTRHPEIEGKVFVELNSVLGDRAPTGLDLENLKYTQAVLKESMRLYPPNRSIGREAIRECEIGGHHIPAGAQLIMSQWVVHRDGRFFRSPEEFKPERWGEDSEDIPKYAYFPFGGGPRVCLGRSFAQIEMVLILARVIQKFIVEAVRGFKVEPRPAILLQPHGEVRVLLRPRDHR